MSYLTVKVNINDWGIQTKLASAAKRAENKIVREIARTTEPFVPMLTGSQVNRTQVKDNKIIYDGPYARFLYYGKVEVDPDTMSAWARYGKKKKPINKDLKYTKAIHKDAQAFWFEASKAQNLDKWKKFAAEELADGIKK